MRRTSTSGAQLTGSKSLVWRSHALAINLVVQWCDLGQYREHARNRAQGGTRCAFRGIEQADDHGGDG